MELPIKGSLHWHISVLQLALLGFRSNKPKLVFESLEIGKRELASE